MLELTLLALLLVAVLLLVHSYFLYIPLLALLARLTPTPDSSVPDSLPSVALVIAAYNEEDIIAEKIENSLELEYPDDRLSIVVFSDASSDRTDEIVRSYADEGVDLVRIEGRVGKTECQNRVADAVDEEIVVFSDANSMYEPAAIRELVASFGPDVGCVVGELKYRDSSDVDGESIYWRYESLIKRLESAVGSSVTGNGAIYAVRNSSYVPLRRGAISDFAEPLAIVANGERVAYTADAVAWESTEETVDDELDRRSRIVTRSWHTVANNAGLLNPVRYPVFSFQLLSHKVLRWLSPILLAVALLSNLALVLVSTSPIYLALLGAQLTFYALALAGAALDRTSLSPPTLVHVPHFFLVANYGMLVGLWNFLRRENIVTWNTTARDSSQNEETEP
ncbi:family 2 glycosyl transferase [Natronococcus amylolyticus DSM 10524]|uniref:Family 2 glycosyl transferase n=1 Tax=Natronococcus amylolyticus DSM 10524 TaxID=1227497 RepID=L9WZI7_9EURY|nr:glycosyltransferase family 2 protein [Natronococcus amylolyticus]ELY54576.1 family 2 glycosyl transferase [Natronococcus amylolyticus DSM 10524]